MARCSLSFERKIAKAQRIRVLASNKATVAAGPVIASCPSTRTGSKIGGAPSVGAERIVIVAPGSWIMPQSWQAPGEDSDRANSRPSRLGAR